MDFPAYYHAGLTYTYGKDMFRWIFEAGYNYLNNPETELSYVRPVDWSNLHVAAGIKYYFIDPGQEVINASDKEIN